MCQLNILISTFVYTVFKTKDLLLSSVSIPVKQYGPRLDMQYSKRSLNSVSYWGITLVYILMRESHNLLCFYSKGANPSFSDCSTLLMLSGASLLMCSGMCTPIHIVITCMFKCILHCHNTYNKKYFWTNNRTCLHTQHAIWSRQGTFLFARNIKNPVARSHGLLMVACARGQNTILHPTPQVFNLHPLRANLNCHAVVSTVNSDIETVIYVSN